MKIKRIFASAAAFVMMISASSLFAYAEEQIQDVGEPLTDGTFTFELINGSYTITACDTTAIVSEIPELRNGYAITAIGDNALTNCTNISSLKIPDSITSIGSNAFAGCTSLKSIELPSRLTTISGGTFMGCTNLASIDIPDSVNTISSYAFYNCSFLTDVRLSGELSSIQPMAFAECSSIENFDDSACASYTFEDGILYNSSKTNICRASVGLAGDVYIPDSVTTIDAGAFSVCTGIENLFIPASVNFIGEDSFGYCTGLKSIDFSEGLSSIADVAFKNCVSLQSLDFPLSLQSIGEGAFYNCTSLSRAVIAEGTKSVGTGAFTSCTALKQINIPKSITEIGDYAFGFSIDENGEYILNDGFSMSVFSDSAGAKYAKSNKIEYTTVDGSLKNLAFIIISAGVVILAVAFAIVLMSKSRKSASAAVKKADKAAQEKADEENYEKIIDD